jgi:hypothetical protein
MFNADACSHRTDRREFLSRCSAAAAAGLIAGAAGAAESAPAPMPTVALGNRRISRLIVGANPMAGYSYQGHAMDREMKEYFNVEHTLAMLQQCEREGIDTHQFSFASKSPEAYRKLRESGAKMQMICLHSKREDIKMLADLTQPFAMAHHGGVTDRFFRENRAGQVRDFVKAVHDQGLLAGVSSHNPDVIQRIADEGWEADFFMTCFYFLSRQTPPGEPGKPPATLEGPKEEPTFYQDDPAAMCAVIRQVKQPCLAFKILGAGRRCASQETVRAAFDFAFKHIKPTDAVIVGMYPRYFDQVRANAEHARKCGVVGGGEKGQS